MARKILDKKWYVILVNRKKLGDHQLLVAPKAIREFDRAQRQFVWREKPRKTRDLRRAVSFESRDLADRFAKQNAIPRGFDAHVEQIPRYAPPRKPRVLVVRTEFGPVKIKEDQICLFGEAEGDVPAGSV